MVIYKYSSVRKAMSNLNLEGIALSSPRFDFNDPYDCNVHISNESYKQAFKLMKDFETFLICVSAVSNGQIKLPRGYKKVFLKDYANYKNNLIVTGKITIEPFMRCLITLCAPKIKLENKVTKERIDKDINNTFPGIVENALVSCFSKRNDSVVMWAHYANNHKGVCVEYEVDNPIFCEVTYGKELPTFDLLEAVSTALVGKILKKPLSNYKYNKKLVEPFYKKSSDWSYEQEVRCVYNSKYLEDGISLNPFIGRYVLPMNNIKSIYLGINCNLESNDVKTLLYMANKRGIPVYKTKLSKDNYSIEIDELLDVSEYKNPSKTNYNDSVGFLKNQISKSIKDREMLDGLFISLFAISHCSNLFNGDAKERFISFYNQYVLLASNNDTYLPSGEVIFEMKEQLFNHGDTNINVSENDTNITELKIDLSEPYELLNISISGKIVGKSGNSRLNMNAFVFCECIEKALQLFEADYQSSLSKLPKLSFYNKREDMFDLKWQ